MSHSLLYLHFVCRIDLVQLSSKSDSAGVQQKNASSYYMKKTTRKMITQHTTDEKGRNIVVTLLKRVASMSELQIEHNPSVDSGRTFPGRIMQFIRSHTKPDLNLGRSDGPLKSISMRFSFRSNRVAADHEDEIEDKNPAVLSLNAPIEDDGIPAPQLGNKICPEIRNQKEIVDREDPVEAKDCEDRFRTFPKVDSDGLSLHPFTNLNTQSSDPVCQDNTLIPAKRRIVKKVSKSNSFASSVEEDRSYKNPMEYIRQNSNPENNRPSSSKDLRSSPSLPSYPQDSLKSASKGSFKANNFFVSESKPSHQVPAPLPKIDVKDEEDKSSLPSTPVTPTRYDRKTSMKLDSLPNPALLTPRDKGSVTSHLPQLHLHSEGESTNIHSSESLMADIDTFSLENMKDQFFTILQNGADEALNAFGLRQYGSCINLNDCLKSTFSASVG